MAAELKAALVQLNSGPEMAANLDAADDLIREAALAGAQFVLTPEMTSLLETRNGPLLEKTVTESEDPGLARFCGLARELGLWLLIGSLPVKTSADKLANRSFLIGPEGKIEARYNKIHMFDVDLEGGESYRESKTFEAGNVPVLAPTPWGMVGLTVCYDLRFPYLFRKLALMGAGMLAVPAAFTKVTGQAHWHVLLRARAIETGCFVLAPAQCGEHSGGRETYGHSLIVNPWGEIIGEALPGPGLVVATIDMNEVDKARRKIPSLEHTREFGRT
jgi:predicted amidohydrolase